MRDIEIASLHAVSFAMTIGFGASRIVTATPNRSSEDVIPAFTLVRLIAGIAEFCFYQSFFKCDSVHDEVWDE